jgi:hypothetical protein
MTSLIAAAFGGAALFQVLLTCSLLLYFYASHIFDIILTILAVAVFYSLISSPIYMIVVMSVGLASILLGLYVKQRVLIAGIMRRASSLRLLLVGVYGLLFGASLVLLNGGVVGIGLAVVAFVLGVILTAYSGRRISADGSLGIKGEDPVRTVSLIILLNGLLIMLGGLFGLFLIFFSGFLILVVYNRLYLAVTATVLIALLLFIALGAVYAVTVIFIGVVAVPLGVFTVRRKAQELMKATGRKKK